jgi:3-oxoacyl-[acyl-carrier-protein] synthase II
METKAIITGLGVYSSLGEGVETNWKNLTEQIFPKANIATGGYSRACVLARSAVQEALNDALLWEGHTLQSVDPERVGCIVSASKPLFDGECVISPDCINRGIKKHFGLSGESRNVVAACATGAYSIALGASWIEQGICDVVVAGSVEPYPHPLFQAGFRQMGVVSGDGLTRPFDRRRTGFTFGEGAGVVILESEAHAQRRGIRALARLSGWGMGADTHSSFALNSNGAKIAGVIGLALQRSSLTPRDIRHVNAHGTATRLNDCIETQALMKAFGSHSERLMISATKASTGHLLGASGSVEFVFTVMALLHQYILPTATLEEPDTDCPLDYTPRKGHGASFEHALSLSFGFGGPVGALVVSRP